MKTVYVLVPVVGLALGLGIFMQGQGDTEPNTSTEARAEQRPPALTDPVIPPMPVEQPALAQPKAATPAISGEVLETMDVAAYTYARLKTAEGEAWVAVSRVKLEVGQRISVKQPHLMRHFESKTLGRSFDAIYFGSIQDELADSQGSGSDAQASAKNPEENKPAPLGVTGEPAQKNAGEAPLGPLKIADLYAKPEAHAGQVIRVRGRVAKITLGIMGKSFIHLQDGSGAEAQGNHDLAVTSLAEPAQGSEVRFEGLLKSQVDLGFGYKYALLLEDAKLVQD